MGGFLDIVRSGSERHGQLTYYGTNWPSSSRKINELAIIVRVILQKDVDQKNAARKACPVVMVCFPENKIGNVERGT